MLLSLSSSKPLAQQTQGDLQLKSYPFRSTVVQGEGRNPGHLSETSCLPSRSPLRREAGCCPRRLLGITSLEDTWHNPSLPGQANWVRVPGCPQEELGREGFQTPEPPSSQVPIHKLNLEPPWASLLCLPGRRDDLVPLGLPGVGASEFYLHVKVTVAQS